MYKKISKTQAQKSIKNNEDVYIVTSRVDPNIVNRWIKPYMINKECLKHYNTDFEEACNEFQYYNCCKELGSKINFYIKEC